ncbi:5-formyltetrahydrofolate cyclo-ligase [Leptospira biflexa]|uniref:5-formyltetrahydrofolate cyclo-ligase n=1 Tax=Leptospira biflexa serovar Patoc (strain Patoc 1 / ATCC 23582 / Paris) TaxID=456481 RepID=B0SKZ1_LEPBP|nr:5-formyltetrahydrofolate cyclo-ligase [Leptospira biflexa]ABZ94816.1 5-formyltetrahydrofolate cyclo-ligase [Leptospira biflexa serovar Patoc strain 'Patoc 1 (Ames)']ABZ98484.1 Putative 5-formyltetrahydrofolate cyclo-ligase [Leptospira biflexa serovar Patoc strain 'Patoc 1 (Paris)']TGM31101.1 5-formyltetrahydrofolate cyclo-ligase [Leptospira biflexa]TGM34561.1 5-formyltetrahydrofolate cyclo-ligase [Leptospira biflexa]TGM44017.1 5-formyltetrahydrofolate cyclo-ligase [Leptospira biflexa]
MNPIAKKDAREILKTNIAKLTDREELEAGILKRLFPLLQGKSKIITYVPDLRFEVDVLPVVESSPLPRPTGFIELRHSAKWYFPKIETDKGLRFIRPFTFEKGAYGMWEPLGDEEISVEEADLILVPALGYHQNGYRLGRGGGYYDRILTSESIQKKSIGFSFSKFFPVPFLYEEHDAKVGKMITEFQILSFFD